MDPNSKNSLRLLMIAGYAFMIIGPLYMLVEISERFPLQSKQVQQGRGPVCYAYILPDKDAVYIEFNKNLEVEWKKVPNAESSLEAPFVKGTEKLLVVTSKARSPLIEGIWEPQLIGKEYFLSIALYTEVPDEYKEWVDNHRSSGSSFYVYIKRNL